MSFTENTTIVNNEFGSNYCKSSFDPLAAIETKNAICGNKEPRVVDFIQT
jgi:hypothetical protein